LQAYNRDVEPSLHYLNEDATQGEIISAVNQLTSRFIERCLEKYHELAQSLETDDWAQNVFMAKRVSSTGSRHYYFV